ncbi:uncharacterized protein [Dysidea avara]|uniref:uncharacterized protein n=1 Tax=Dysidea avara TaxID=196820 RepID=UPI003327B50E
MARVILASVVIQMVLVVWGLPPPPPKYSTTESVFVVSIGEPIVVPEGIQVVFDCGELIENSTVQGGVAIVNWYKDGRRVSNNSVISGSIISNNSVVYGERVSDNSVVNKEIISNKSEVNNKEIIRNSSVVYGDLIRNNSRMISNNSESYDTTISTVYAPLSPDKRTMEITTVMSSIPSQIGGGGIYSCIACVDDKLCFDRTTIMDVCIPPQLDKGSGMVVPQNPVVIMIKCGQDYEAPAAIIGHILCPEFQRGKTKVSVFKNDVEIKGFAGIVRFGPNDIFGTYKFISENNCGRDVAVTRITRKVVGCKITSVNGIYEVIGSNAIITFSADHVPVHDKIKFRCKLDHKGYEPCTSPQIYRKLSLRKHHVIVRAECPDDQSSKKDRKFDFNIYS